MSKTFLIFGVKRTGNHAIIHWLIPQMSNGVRFFNDHKYFHYEDNNVDEHTLNEHLLQLWNGRLFINYVKQRGCDSYLKEYTNVDNMISFEGISLQDVLKGEEEWLNILNKSINRKYNPNIKIGENKKYIILLRNPWNIFASQIKWGDSREGYNRLDIDVDVWKGYYELYLNPPPNVHIIIFDKWFMDINYRKEISKSLEIEFTDLTLNKVAKAGGGSTFDKLEFDGRAQEMNVLNRYKQMMNHEKMIEWLNGSDAKELKEKWNYLCDKEKIKKLKIK